MTYPPGPNPGQPQQDPPPSGYTQPDAYQQQPYQQAPYPQQGYPAQPYPYPQPPSRSRTKVLWIVAGIAFAIGIIGMLIAAPTTGDLSMFGFILGILGLLIGVAVGVAALVMTTKGR
jgi:hypothetical protein